MFSQAELFSKALLIEAPWFVSELKFDQDKGRLDIWIDFERGSLFYYEDASLGVKGEFKAYDTRQKTWRHLNFFQYGCYLLVHPRPQDVADHHHDGELQAQ